MAGHSHSANIARRKNAVDAKRGKDFSKYARAIISAARQGGPDIDQNLKLKYAIEKAKAGPYNLNERQAKAILEMRLQRLTGLEREKIEAEYRELCDEIARLEAIYSRHDPESELSRVNRALAEADVLADGPRISGELESILSEEQFAALEAAIAEHRAERTQRRIDNLGEGLDRRVEFLTNVLGLDGGTAAAVRDAGYPLLAYTVNDAKRAAKLFGWGVDAVFSDYPDRLLAM